MILVSALALFKNFRTGVTQGEHTVALVNDKI